MGLLQDKMEQLHALCRRYRVKRMHVFGSVLTPRFTEESDVDLLVEFEPGMAPLEYGENYLDLHLALEDLYGREVDLVEEDCLTNPFFRRNVERNKQLIDGWAGREICQTAV